jgi:hypothetical protein
MPTPVEGKIGERWSAGARPTGLSVLDLLSSKADWIARTADDVRQLREAGEGPLAKLPEPAFQEFLNSLEFKGGGVAHGYYKPLMFSLTLTEIFEVFERFGLSRECLLTFSDWSCNWGTGACVEEEGVFCTSACGSR